MTPRPEASEHEARREWTLIAFACAAGAAGVHLGAVGSHIGEYPPAGAFMLAAGLAQLAWAVWIVAGTRRSILLAGRAGNAAVVALWFTSRTAGLPWGHDPWTSEHVHGTDLLATALEILVVVAAGALASDERDRPAPVLVRLACVGAAATLIVTGDDPAREQLAATATLAIAATARFLVLAVSQPSARRLDWRNHVEAPLPGPAGGVAGAAPGAAVGRS